MILLRILLALWRPIAALLGIGAVYIKGRTDARQTAKLRAQKTYINRRKRLDNTDDALPDDAGVLREWLRNRPTDKP